MIVEPKNTHPRSNALDVALGEWLAASGQGTYQCDGERATVQASFENFVPNGVYTIWNFIDADPPTDPWQTLV